MGHAGSQLREKRARVLASILAETAPYNEEEANEDTGTRTGGRCRALHGRHRNDGSASMA
jgi:hypothetical protein